MRLFVVLLCLVALLGVSLQAAPMRAATKVALNATTHFTLDKNEQQDFAVQLPVGSYYIVCDLARMDERADTIIGQVQLLKANGAMVKDRLLRFAEMGPVMRVGDKFAIAKPLSARFRVLNTDEPIEVWMTIIPAKQMKFIPYAFKNGDLKPLGIGTEEGKGGTLNHREYAFHSIKLKPGKYDVSLYFQGLSGKSDSLIGSRDRYDAYGFRVPLWNINLGSVGLEARKDKQLILTKEQTVILRAFNSDNPAEYTIGIEKSED